MIVVTVIVTLVALYFAAKEFQFIAEEKGYPGKKYFWWVFLFAMFGIPMVIALPNKSGTVKSVSADEIPDI